MEQRPKSKPSFGTVRYAYLTFVGYSLGGMIIVVAGVFNGLIF